MTIRHLLLFALTLTLTRLASHQLHADEKPVDKFNYLFQHAADDAEAKGNSAKTTFTITSKGGIGRVQIGRQEEQWPKKVEVRLRLKSLEQFSASNDQFTLETGITASSYGGAPMFIGSKREGKDETILDKSSPLWLSPGIFNDDGTQAKSAPLKAGYFEDYSARVLLREEPEGGYT